MAFPKQYEENFPDRLVDHMGQGLSFESFGGEVGVSFNTLHRWVRENPTFAEAKERGEIACLRYWEKMGISGMFGQVAGFIPSIWIFSMKARFKKFGWTDAVPNAKTPDVSDEETQFKRKLAEMNPGELVKTVKDELVLFEAKNEGSNANAQPN